MSSLCVCVCVYREKNHFLGVGAYSFALFVTNFVVIFLMALGVFKVRCATLAVACYMCVWAHARLRYGNS